MIFGTWHTYYILGNRGYFRVLAACKYGMVFETAGLKKVLNMTTWTEIRHVMSASLKL